jgi:hypothetical protein
VNDGMLSLLSNSGDYRRVRLFNLNKKVVNRVGDELFSKQLNETLQNLIRDKRLQEA